MKPMETTEEVSSDGVKKCVERRNWPQIGPCAREKPREDLKKVLGNLLRVKIITKKPHAVRWPETIWEIPV